MLLKRLRCLRPIQPTDASAAASDDAETTEAADAADSSDDDAINAETQVAGEALGPNENAPEAAMRPNLRAAAAVNVAAASRTALDELAKLDVEIGVDRLGPGEGDDKAGARDEEAAPKPTRRPSLEDVATRRVMAAATTRVEAAAPPAGGMILLGVFKGRSSERALVRTTKGSQRVEIGDEIDGWRVTAITHSSVQLRRASNVRMLRMP